MHLKVFLSFFLRLCSAVCCRGVWRQAFETYGHVPYIFHSSGTGYNTKTAVCERGKLKTFMVLLFPSFLVLYFGIVLQNAKEIKKDRKKERK